MILAPPDRARGRRIKQAAVSCVKHGEGFYLVGFDWQPLVAFTEFNAAMEFADQHRPFMDFRAVVRVFQGRGTFFNAVVVELSGDPSPYGIRAKPYGSQVSVDWTKPDRLGVHEAELLAHGR